MDIEELREKIWRIADGIPLKLGNMYIKTTNTEKLLVTGWTNTIHFNNISKGTILQELNQLKESFSDLTDSFDEMKDFVKNKNLTIEYHMAYDAGKAGISLCSEINETINWYIE